MGYGPRLRVRFSKDVDPHPHPRCSCSESAKSGWTSLAACRNAERHRTEARQRILRIDELPKWWSLRDKAVDDVRGWRTGWQGGRQATPRSDDGPDARVLARDRPHRALSLGTPLPGDNPAGGESRRGRSSGAFITCTSVLLELTHDFCPPTTALWPSRSTRSEIAGHF